MGRGRGRQSALACVLGTLALVGAGCGAKAQVNDPRPPIPTRVSVSITRNAVTVQPVAVGIGPNRNQQIPQNQQSPQPNIPKGGPLTVVFVAANLTDFDSHLDIHGPLTTSSGPIVANGNGSYQVDLPTGVYTISAADIPAATPAHLVVGSYRASSKNDLLLP